MAADLMNGLRVCRKGRACCNGLVLLLMCAGFPVVSAQALIDPTKPPAEISAVPVGQAVAPKDSGLQSIIISTTRRAAIINGQTVELGAKYGDARLVGVSESGVVLEGSQGRQVLALFPGVEIQRKELPEKDNMKHATQRKNPVKKPASQAGKKEEK